MERCNACEINMLNTCPNEMGPYYGDLVIWNCYHKVIAGTKSELIIKSSNYNTSIL
jgi:hypothetical protein